MDVTVEPHFHLDGRRVARPLPRPTGVRSLPLGSSVGLPRRGVAFQGIDRVLRAPGRGAARQVGGQALKLSREDAAPTGWSRRFDGPLDALGEVYHVLRSTRVLIGAYRGGVPPARREAVMVAVSQANACRACNTVHQWWALRAGVSRQKLDAIGLGDLMTLDMPTRAAIVHATSRVSERFRAPAPQEVTATAVEHLGARQLQQIEAIARAMSLANLFLNTVRDGWSGEPTRSPERRNRPHPLFARFWDRVAPRVVSDDARAELLAGLSGTVVEIGAGNGANFSHYPVEVTSVCAIEPEPRLRARAAERARTAAVPVEVVDATAESLPADDDSFDNAVCCLVLCSVPDQRAALRELRRVVRPGGEVRFYEHVAARDRRRRVQRFLDFTGIWPTLAGGCHLGRDTAAELAAAGFAVERSQEYELGVGRLLIPHIMGVARVEPRTDGLPLHRP